MIKCGIIGCGVIAPTHIAGINAIPNAKLEALCDIDETRLNQLSDEHQIAKRYTNYHDMLKDKEIDLVHICTDHASHCQIVVDALNAGKSIIFHIGWRINGTWLLYFSRKKYKKRKKMKKNEKSI